MLLLFLMLCLPAAHADEIPLEMQAAWEKEHPHSLPIWLTPEERQRLHEIGEGFEPTPPPRGPKRQGAEFEPMEGVLIRYPFGISYSVIAEMSQDLEVVTVVANSSQQSYVHSQYASHGVNTGNCSYLLASSDSYWTRDYGPWFIINAYDEQGIVDTIYNRPRPNDDKIPAKYGQWQGIPVYAMDLITAGGNYMCDGQGIAVSTDLVWSENPGKTHGQIDQMVLDYLGIHTYHVIPDALGQYIEHIDCFAKFLSPETIMIIEVAPSHSQYDELEDAVAYFESQLCCYGWPYDVVRVYTPSGQPYVNSLILNDKVFVPQTGSSWDDDALLAYETAMPGYEALGFTGSWVTTDALHCRTMGITDRYMLYIHHVPLVDPAPTPSGFLVEAEVIAYSNQSLVNDTPKVYWKTGGGWNAIAMGDLGGNQYATHIPLQPNGTLVSYYIHAQDGSGRDENHPYIGEPGAHTFISYNPFGPNLDADLYEISRAVGGQVNFTLDAGMENADRDYLLLATASGTSPGTPLPGGLATLPLNWDAVTDVVMLLLNTYGFSSFLDQLDASGSAAAQLNTGPLPTGTSGITLHFAYLLNDPWDFVSDPLAIEIVD